MLNPCLLVEFWGFFTSLTKHEEQLHVPLHGVKHQHSLCLFLGMHLDCHTVGMWGISIIAKAFCRFMCLPDEIEKKYRNIPLGGGNFGLKPQCLPEHVTLLPVHMK